MPAPVITPNALPVAPIAPVTSPASTGAAGGAAFHSAFTDAISKVESFQDNAQSRINSFLSGESEELHQVALATQKAELSFELFMQVRNKVVSAYQEVMRMQV